MPDIDLTITISVILALAAVVSPIFTTIINNRYQLKLKKLEMIQTADKESSYYKRGVLEEYLKAAGACTTVAVDSDFVEFGKVYPLALLYFPESLQNEVVALNKLILTYNREEARRALDQLAPKIRAILQTM